MGILHKAAQYRAYKEGVVHTTLNPKGPGSVRIHLIPPKWRLFSNAPYVMILNGYYILPLGYSWAILLGSFIGEVNKFEGEPIDERHMEQIMDRAVARTRRVYYVKEEELRADLQEILTMLYGVARGEEPSGDIEPLSLREYARNMTAPHRMDLMISSMLDEGGNWNCSLKCRNCYAAGQPAAGGKELSTQEWYEIIDRCRRAGICQLTFTGGEPTMRSDLAELVRHARWFVTRLNTNGTMLTGELCEALYEASLDSVQITLYSGDVGIHNRLVGADLPGSTGNWEKTAAGLENALKAGLNVSVNTPLCRENRDYIRTLAFLNKAGVRYVTCSGLIETGKAESGDSQLTVEEMNSLLREAIAFCSQHGMELSFTSPGRADKKVLEELGIAVPMCGACLSNMAVAPDGSVVPCQSWLGEGAALGNMRKDSWKKIWNHPSCKAIREMSEEEALYCPLRKEKTAEGKEAAENGHHRSKV